MRPFGVFGGMFLLIFLIMWKIYSKAGQPGWAALIPIYNQWILVTEICKKEPLWFVLMLLPVANIVAAWVVSMELAKKFGKSETFGIGLFFLAPIFLAILAFGDAEYQGGRNSKKRSRARDDDEDEHERVEDRHHERKFHRPQVPRHVVLLGRGHGVGRPERRRIELR